MRQLFFFSIIALSLAHTTAHATDTRPIDYWAQACIDRGGTYKHPECIMPDSSSREEAPDAREEASDGCGLVCWTGRAILVAIGAAWLSSQGEADN